MKNTLAIIILSFICSMMYAQSTEPNTDQNKFRQLGQELPTPNVYRNGAGAPGSMYWQNRADYEMQVRIDDETQRLYGEETITYMNNSPDDLEYLWIQLDQNVRSLESQSQLISTNKLSDQVSMWQMNRLMPTFDGGFKIDHVKDSKGNDLSHTVVHTMMRIDLPQPLNAGNKISFSIKWWYNINDRSKIGGRSGYEFFESDSNYLYTIAQFFPRMCKYSDIEGWQNKQFLGSGEFTLEFGDYKVAITVPADHQVASTGVLSNEKNVLTSKQIERLEKSRTASEPVMIVTQEEAIKAESENKSTKEKTWIFEAKNVRDFAFANSRKFIWDAMGVKQSNGTTVMAMSMYPKEGNPLWERYSTKAVAHTLKWYSHYTFPYPYPVAWSIHTDRIGMEYPMICFNGGRPEADGTYTSRTKYGMISVIIHEVGHNYFPMIVNSDERQWTWMDEGLNSFLQYLSEQQWERNYPSRRGPAPNIVSYMKSDKESMVPIMVNSEYIKQFGNNAYGKPATALNILRESVLGRENFDHAFKIYSNRWMFKHPAPADFFRTMEDASGIDLDWFWRGWFYTTDNVDIALSDVQWKRLDTKEPDYEMQFAKSQKIKQPTYISEIRNRQSIKKTQDEIDESLRDFYTEYDEMNIDALQKMEYEQYASSLSDDEKALMDSNYYFYELTFTNKGGLVMPIILMFEFEDGSNELIRIPAEIWQGNNIEVSKVFPVRKQVRNIILDPYLETADVDRENNYFPPQSQLNRFELYKYRGSRQRENPMQRAKRVEEMQNGN